MNIKNKLTLLITLACLALLSSCKKEEKKQITANNVASITGSILDNSNGTISLTEINEDTYDKNINVIRSVSLKNGKFSFNNLKVDVPRAVKLTFGDTINTIVFLEPGLTNVEIFPKDSIFTEYLNGVEVRSKRTGTINNELFTAYRNKRNEIIKSPKFIELRALDKSFFDLDADLDLMNKQMSQFSKRSIERDSILINLKTEFILAHNDKMVSPYILLLEDDRFDDVFKAKEIISFFDNFSKKLSGNMYYDRVEQFVNNSRSSAVGITLLDFSLKNREGKTVSLSSFKDKYVLIDFWAYWCKPCIAAFPHLEKLLKKYKKDGFDVLGISSDSNYEKWIKMLDKHQPSWTQVIDTDDKKISKQFNIVKLPTTFLIDKQGAVLAIDLSAVDLDAKLFEIFGH